MCRLILAGILAGTFAFALPESARSQIVTATFTGTVTAVQTGYQTVPPPGVNVGSPVTGTIVYNSAFAVPTTVPPWGEDYAFPDGAMYESVSIATYNWYASQEVHISILNDEPPPYTPDVIDFEAQNDVGTGFPYHLNGDAIMRVQLGGTAAMLSSLALPIVSSDINLSAVTYEIGWIRTDGVGPLGGEMWEIDYSINSFSLDSPTAVQGTTWGGVKALYR